MPFEWMTAYEMIPKSNNDDSAHPQWMDEDHGHADQHNSGVSWVGGIRGISLSQMEGVTRKQSAATRRTVSFTGLGGYLIILADTLMYIYPIDD